MCSNSVRTTTSLFLSGETAEKEFLTTLECIGGGFIAFDAVWQII